MSVQSYSIPCGYHVPRLRDVVYLLSQASVTDIHVDGAQCYADSISDDAIQINCKNLSLEESSSLDERYKFEKTLTFTMLGRKTLDSLEDKYFIIVEDFNGNRYMVTPEFPSVPTYTYNLSEGESYTQFTLKSVSNYPTLPFTSDFSYTAYCPNLFHPTVASLKLIDRQSARLDTRTDTILTYQDSTLQEISPLKGTVGLTEAYDGRNLTTSLSFRVPLRSDFLKSWHISMLEFIYNRYAGVIETSDGNMIFIGFDTGLQPNVTLNDASTDSEEIGLTLVEMTEKDNYTSTSAYTVTEDEETYLKPQRRHGTLKTYECIGLGKAHWLLEEQFDANGNPTGGWYVYDGHQSEYPTLNIVGEFYDERVFSNDECEGDTCLMMTNMPLNIHYQNAICYNYQLQSTCDWTISNVSSFLSISPTAGTADVQYDVAVCNTVMPTSSFTEGGFDISYGDNVRHETVTTQNDESWVNPKVQWIDCLEQYVTFSFRDGCRPTGVTLISEELSYEFTDSQIIVHVPFNGTSNAKAMSMTVQNCNGDSFVLAVMQDRLYTEWKLDDSLVNCVSGDSYQVLRLYSGTTSASIDIPTDQTMNGGLIKVNDAQCENKKRWLVNSQDYVCYGGNKYEPLREYISVDGEVSWSETGKVRLGEMIESASTDCDEEDMQYRWELTQDTQCIGDADYSSYFLYKKYESVDGQSWHEVYPTTVSIDGDGTETMVLNMSGDTKCGYRPDITPIYSSRTSTASDYMCTGYDKHYKVYQTVSYDGGQTYSDTGVYTEGALIEANSTDCGYSTEYEWFNSGTSCVTTSLYYRQIKMVSHDGGTTYETVIPEEWRLGSKIEDHSSSCGCQYDTKWVDSGTSYYICEGADKFLKLFEYETCDGVNWTETGNVDKGTLIESASTDCGYQVRWIDSGSSYYVCDNGNKYLKEFEQVSYDSGTTWTDTGNIRKGSLIESDSADCGYQLRWVESGASYYVCDNANKYLKEFEQVTRDGGATWTNTGNERKGALIQSDSTDCGFRSQWITSGTSYYVCDSGSKYYKEFEYVSRDGGTTWSSTGQERKGSLIEAESSDCGFMSRWITAGTSYYVCENANKYYKEFEQVSYDSGSTWTNTGQERKGSLIQSDSSDCGYMSQWVNSGASYYICDGVDKYMKEFQYISRDSGTTWTATGAVRKGSLIESSSSDCGVQRRWVTAGTSYYVCDNASKYYKEIEQISYDSGSTWSATGNERKGSLIEADSYDCGYRTQWVTAGTSYYVCDNANKYYKEFEQFSRDSGTTWTNTGNYRKGSLIETDSYDCGYRTRWQTSGVSYYVCENGSKYYKEYEQTSRDGGTTWSSTGQERKGSLIETNSYDCGYRTRWQEAGGSSYMCDDGDKYHIEFEQVSYDSGTTWSNTGNSRKGSLIESGSTDCAHDYSGDYLTFEALEDDTVIRLTSDGGDGMGEYILYASTDNGLTWYGEDTTIWIYLSKNQKGLVKGNLPINYWINSSITPLYSNNKFNCYGNPMSLYYGDNFAGHNEPLLLGRLFMNSKIVSAENLILPSGVTAHSYEQMFLNTKELKKAPTLPATSLSANSYYQMFAWSGIETPPELPFTVGAEGCCQGMFSYCSALTTCPEIHASALGDNALASMFTNCDNLTQAPSILSANTLGQGVYMNMFGTCQRLKTAPVMTFTTSTIDLCYRMFYWCTALNNIKMMATNINSSHFYQWVYGVSSTGTFYKNANATWNIVGDNGVPNGWTIVYQ